jgi:hypothetical protein
LQAVGDGVTTTPITIRDDKFQASSDVVATADEGGGGGEGRLGRESDNGDGNGGQLHDDVAVAVDVAEGAKERKKESSELRGCCFCRVSIVSDDAVAKKDNDDLTFM